MITHSILAVKRGKPGGLGVWKWTFAVCPWEVLWYTLDLVVAPAPLKPAGLFAAAGAGLRIAEWIASHLATGSSGKETRDAQENQAV